MPVTLNLKMCNRGFGCPCIAACPMKAWSFNMEEDKPVIDLSKCNGCGLCVKACPGRAVLFAYNEQGLAKLKQELEADPRKEEEVFAPRFGADPMELDLATDAAGVEKAIKETQGVLFVELWSAKCTTRCRIGAVLYSELIPKEVQPRIVQVDVGANPQVMEKYKAYTAPSLLIFSKGRLVDYIAGCSTVAEKEILKDRIRKALAKI